MYCANRGRGGEEYSCVNMHQLEGSREKFLFRETRLDALSLLTPVDSKPFSFLLSWTKKLVNSESLFLPAAEAPGER